MKVGHRRRRFFYAVLLAALVPTALVFGVAAAALQDLVGRWTTELWEEDVFAGERYNIRRQIEVNRSDGTKTVTFRFYDDCRMVGELINHGTWGVSNKVYWMRCTWIEQGGQSTPCNTLQEHDIRSVDDKSLTYASRSRGTVYRHTRVDETFSLPGSACTS